MVEIMQRHNAGDGQGGDQTQNFNLVLDIKVIGWLVEDYLGGRLRQTTGK